MHAKAVARYVRVGPDKVRQVIGLIRGLPVEDARSVLTLSAKHAARPVLKTLNSAVANAEHNHDLDADDLVVNAAVVDEGPTLKRFRPRAMGRAYRIRKRTCHITIVVGSEPLAARATAPGGAARNGRPAQATATGEE